MTDLSALSNEELFAMAGIQPPAVSAPVATPKQDYFFDNQGTLNLTLGGALPGQNAVVAPPPQIDFSNMSNEQLYEMAGIKAPPQTPSEIFIGGVGNTVKAATLGLGDEILSGLAAPLASGMSQFTDNPMGLGEAYNKILPDLRGDIKGFRDENPVVSTGQDIIGALTLPVVKGLKAADGILKTGAKLGTQGAMYGAGYGFGEGEGGASNRLENALSGAKLGAAGGAVLGAGGKAIAKGAGALARNAPKWSQKASNEAFGASVADFTKSTRQDGLIRTKDGFTTQLEQHFNTLRKNGILKGVKSAEDILVKHDNQSVPLAKELNKYLNIADKNLKGKKVYPKNFQNAENYITKNAPKDEVASLRKELAKYIEALKTEGSGTIRELQDQKRILYNKVYPEGGKSREGLDMAIAQDLKESIEKFTDSLLPQRLASAVKTTNKKLAPYEATRRLLELKATQEGSAKTSNKVKAFMRTSGGWGVPVLGGAYVGGLPGAAAGAAIGKTSQYMMSPAGSGLRASAYESLAPVAKSVANAARKDLLLPQAGKVAGSVLSLDKDLSGGVQAKQYAPSNPISQNPDVLDPQQSKRTDVEAILQQQPQGTISDTNPSLNSTQNPNPTQYEKQPISYTPKKIREMVANEPPLIKAMISQESGFRHKAVSNKGARGLLQIMPATAKDIAKELGIEKYDLNDPETNLMFGKYYINKMYKKYQDPELALAAYNAGDGAVDRWIKQYGKSWKTISRNLKARNYYKETTAYVPSIINKVKNNLV